MLLLKQSLMRGVSYLIRKLNIDIRNWLQNKWVLKDGKLEKQGSPLIRPKIKVGSSVLDTLLFNQVFYPVSWFKWYFKKAQQLFKQWNIKKTQLIISRTLAQVKGVVGQRVLRPQFVRNVRH